MGQCSLRNPRVTEKNGVPEMADFLSTGAEILVMVSKPRRGLSVWFSIKCKKQKCDDTPPSPGGTEQMGTQSITNLRARTLQCAAMWDPLPSPGRISVDAYLRSLQSLAHTKVKTVYP